MAYHAKRLGQVNRIRSKTATANTNANTYKTTWIEFTASNVSQVLIHNYMECNFITCKLQKLMGYIFRYRNLVKRLIVCHDQMVQTQKRDLIKRVLDCAVGRMLEYKKEIVNLDCNDYQFSNFILKRSHFRRNILMSTVQMA